MTIYGEYLFIENFIVASLLLILTGKLVGVNARKTRIAAGAFAGAIGSFILFIPMTVYLSILLRIITGVLSVALAFGKDLLVKITAIYFILTFASGGMVMALSLWIQKPTIAHQGIIYMESLTYFRLLSLGILSFGSVYWFIKFIRSKSIGKAIYGQVRIELEGNSFSFRGYVDSGNYLKNPVDFKDVILIDRVGAKKLLFRPEDMPNRYGLVPYKAVGTKNGLLEAVRTDKVFFGDKVIEGAWLAFYDENFIGYQVLLNRSFLEGGLLNDALSESN